MKISVQNAKNFVADKKDRIAGWWQETGRESLSSGTDLAITTLPMLVVAGLGTVIISYFSAKATVKGMEDATK